MPTSVAETARAGCAKPGPSDTPSLSTCPRQCNFCAGASASGSAGADACTLDPARPTEALPGSIEKIEVLAERARKRLPLFHSEDAKLTDGLCYLPADGSRGSSTGAAQVAAEGPLGELRLVGVPKAPVAKGRGLRQRLGFRLSAGLSVPLRRAA